MIFDSCVSLLSYKFGDQVRIQKFESIFCKVVFLIEPKEVNI